MGWNADKYLQFENERTQPCIDLANRIRSFAPKSIIDLGCGPGNSTNVLQTVFPESDILGIDNSQNMIDKARSAHPEIRFELCGVRDISGSYDVIFSNACLQWLDDHDSLIEFLMSRLNDGGVLAVQMPMNGEEPLYRIIREVVGSSEFDFSSVCFEKNDVLAPDKYYDILSKCSSGFHIWETVYYHTMKSHEQLVDWVRATRLRPYLEVLRDEEKAAFEAQILEKVRSAYPFTENGSIILRFRRLFFTAVK